MLGINTPVPTTIYLPTQGYGVVKEEHWLALVRSRTVVPMDGRYYKLVHDEFPNTYYKLIAGKEGHVALKVVTQVWVLDLEEANAA